MGINCYVNTVSLRFFTAAECRSPNGTSPTVDGSARILRADPGPPVP